jgi:hypothetical protein
MRTNVLTPALLSLPNKVNRGRHRTVGAAGKELECAARRNRVFFISIRYAPCWVFDFVAPTTISPHPRWLWTSAFEGSSKSVRGTFHLTIIKISNRSRILGQNYIAESPCWVFDFLAATTISPHPTRLSTSAFEGRSQSVRGTFHLALSGSSQWSIGSVTFTFRSNQVKNKAMRAITFRCCTNHISWPRARPNLSIWG